jgi:hypothetical protein
MRASTCANLACSAPSYACVCAYRSRAQYEHKHAHELFLRSVSSPAHINSGRCTHAHACRSRAHDRRAPRMRGRGRGRAAALSPLSAWPCAGCGGWVGWVGGGVGPWATAAAGTADEWGDWVCAEEAAAGRGRGWRAGRRRGSGWG